MTDEALGVLKSVGQTDFRTGNLQIWPYFKSGSPADNQMILRLHYFGGGARCGHIFGNYTNFLLRGAKRAHMNALYWFDIYQGGSFQLCRMKGT